jgi:outer membrane receptor for ferric coprogen and ferric-rhodotorulic acid
MLHRDFSLRLTASSIAFCFTFSAQTLANDAPVELETLTVSGKRFQSSEQSSSYTVQSTNTSSRLDLSLRETPQSVTVVTQQLMDDFQLDSITDVINQVTGVSSKAYDSSRSGYSARGFDITNLQIDGVPTTWESGWSAGETQTDTLLFDRIEIVRGSNGLISGAGNPAAAINLVRKRADSVRFQGKATLSAGSWDSYSSSIDVQSPLNDSGSLRGRIVAGYTDEHSFVDYEENQKTVVLGTISFDVTDNTLLNAGISQQRNHPKGSMWGGLPVWYSDGTRTDWNRSKTTAPKWATWGSTVTNYYANIEHTFESGIKTYAAYSKTYNNADLKLAYLYGYPDNLSGLGMSASNSWYDNQRTQDNLDIYTSIPFDFRDLEHELVIGMMHTNQSFTADRRYASDVAEVGNFLTWDGNYSKPTWGAKVRYTEQDTEQTGAYVVSRLSLAEPVKLIIGTRITNWDISGMKWNGEQYQYEHKDIITPYAGLIYDINDRHSTYISYSEIFNPQDAQDRNGDYLDPIEGKNYEVGIKSEYLDGRINTSLSVFRIEQDNLAQDDIGQFIPGTTNQASYAAQGTTSRGFEMEVNGAISENWNITAGWSQYKAKDINGDPINTRYPRKSANLFTTYTINQLTLGTGIRWESSNYTIATNPQGDTEKLKQDAYTLVDVMAKYQFTPQLSAQLNINNLLDEEYYSQIGFYNQMAYGEPRNTKLTLIYNF